MVGAASSFHRCLRCIIRKAALAAAATAWSITASTCSTYFPGCVDQQSTPSGSGRSHGSNVAAGVCRHVIRFGRSRHAALRLAAPSPPNSRLMAPTARRDSGWTGAAGWVRPDNGRVLQGTLRVYGSAGSLRIHHYANKLFLTDRNGCREVHTSYGTAPWHFGAQLAAFLDSLIHDKPPPISADDGLRALTALLAAYVSERCGQWQTVARSVAEQAHSPSTVR